VNAEYLIVEVVDEAGLPCPPVALCPNVWPHRRQPRRRRTRSHGGRARAYARTRRK
jgi:hypothetical protein